MENLDEDKVKECRAVFDLFDDDHDGVIPKDKLGDLMRVLGAAPSIEEVDNYMKKIRGGSFDFKIFIKFFAEKFNTQDTEDDLINEFKKLDKNGNGFISKDDLIDLMKHYGDSLSDDEIDEIIEIATPDRDGNIDYEKFSKILIGR